MPALLFPGQGAQFEKMGMDLYDDRPKAADLFEEANEILGFQLSPVMFYGSSDDLKETRITQPAIYMHSVVSLMTAEEEIDKEAVAGHSLGEFSALVASGVLSWQDGLQLVKTRAEAMQRACEDTEGTMAAILGMEAEQIIDICAKVSGEVVAANFNSPGQIVISGETEAVKEATEKLKEAGAKRAILLPVRGAFHSSLMQPAADELSKAITATDFQKPQVPIYQNVNAKAETDIDSIKKNLLEQLTSPVKWTATMQSMIADGIHSFREVGGNGKVLKGLLKKLDRKLECTAL